MLIKVLYNNSLSKNRNKNLFLEKMQILKNMAVNT